MKLQLVLAVFILIVAVANCEFSVKPKCRYDCCVEVCKNKYAHWWQRFCHSSRIKIYCYAHQYLYIHKAMYGNIVCSPSNVQYTGGHTCGSNDAATTNLIRKFCNYKNKCYGYANNYLMDGNTIPFAYTCPYATDHFYVEYYCKPKQSYCISYCRCRQQNYNDYYCKTNYKKY